MADDKRKLVANTLDDLRRIINDCRPGDVRDFSVSYRLGEDDVYSELDYGEATVIASAPAPETGPVSGAESTADADELAPRRGPRPDPHVVQWTEHNLGSHGVYYTSPVLTDAARDHGAQFPHCTWRP